MFKIFVTCPDLPFVHCLDALGKRFQGVASVEHSPCSIAKSVYHPLWFGILQEHDRRSTLSGLRLLQDFDARFRAVLKFFTDQCDVSFVCSQLSNDFLRTASQRLDRKALSTMQERIFQ